MKKTLHQKMRNVLQRECACYILITCQGPSHEGAMHVEMTWEGEACLAHALLERAQEVVEEEDEQEVE